MVAMFNGNHSRTIIICYSPINASVEMDLITFYNQLSSFVCSIPKPNVLIIGKDENKKFCLHNSSNRNGEHLTDFSLENGIKIILISRKVSENYGPTPTQTIDISNKYVITLRNKFDAPQEISETLTPNDKYENFSNVLMEAAAKFIPAKLRVKQSSLEDINSLEKNITLDNKTNLTNANDQKEN